MLIAQTHNMDVPNVRRSEYQLLDIQDVSAIVPLVRENLLMRCQGFLNLMDADGTPKDDVKVPETDIGKEVLGAFEEGKDLMVTIIASMGRPLFPGLPNCRIRLLTFGSGVADEEQAISWKEAPQAN